MFCPCAVEQKAGEEDILIRITVHNRGDEAADLVLLPTVWFRNLWSYGRANEKPVIIPEVSNDRYGQVKLIHPGLGDYYLAYEKADQILFTENETNRERIYGFPNQTPLDIPQWLAGTGMDAHELSADRFTEHAVPALRQHADGGLPHGNGTTGRPGPGCHRSVESAYFNF